jgi:hypothetical protein
VGANGLTRTLRVVLFSLGPIRDEDTPLIGRSEAYAGRADADETRIARPDHLNSRTADEAHVGQTLRGRLCGRDADNGAPFAGAEVEKSVKDYLGTRLHGFPGDLYRLLFGWSGTTER